MVTIVINFKVAKKQDIKMSHHKEKIVNNVVGGC